MRPTRLELEGFASFRDAVVVDFTGADLFVLTGPTGSGKSSLIDAITFALYGSVPRYRRRGEVAPAITQGRLEAKVRLDFEVEGRQYSAVRVVRRTKTGATTREARLEDTLSKETLAASSDELTAEVERLVGLPFEHFTRCVVLPQGEFARFLHDEPSERQNLLVKLLDLEIYGRMATAANLRARGADDRIQRAKERLDRDLARATPEARDDARKAIGTLESLAKRVDDARPRSVELDRRGAKAAEDERAATRLAKYLGSIAPAAADLQLAKRVDGERDGERKAAVGLEGTAKALSAATQARAALPAPEPLREVLGKQRQRAQQQAALDDATKRLAAARRAEQTAEQALEKVRAETAAALRAVEASQQRNLAATLQATLEVGGTCPVCGVKIRSLPHGEPPKDLKKAQTALAKAKDAEAEYAKAHRDAHASAERHNGELQARQQELASLEKALKKMPATDLVESTLESIRAADEAVARAREKRDAASAAREAARKRLDAAQESVNTAWRRLDAARDQVTVLGPPPVDRADLGAAWAQLRRWAQAQAPEQHELAAKARQEVEEVRAAIESIRAAIAGAFAAAGLDLASGAEPRAACADALAAARERLRAVAAAIEEATRLRTEIQETLETARIARFLAQHLGARNFESWILNRVMSGLAAAASQFLLDLSSGQYSFGLDDKKRDFLVVDHANAGEVRQARTLSGGETFLASLALALALSEHVSRLAAHGSARLDALFIDEGFGALDPETLETVAAALEDLRARGHMVGIVTHVRELAARIPVQFMVTKDARTSKVRRVAAEDEDPWEA